MQGDKGKKEKRLKNSPGVVLGDGKRRKTG